MSDTREPQARLSENEPRSGDADSRRRDALAKFGRFAVAAPLVTALLRPSKVSAEVGYD